MDYTTNFFRQTAREKPDGEDTGDVEDSMTEIDEGICKSYNKSREVNSAQYGSFSMIQRNYLFASSLPATIPVVILFMMIEKHPASGRVKG